ncbi:hypothetical protein KL86DYS1_10498 [uncultured Dysgonomonas sp.]|uniref:Uncharacterized protein n=1 Tax=uncultured Dysgonomonas sp. TaxID=206096 RepID=A0A212IYL0_9BACT|nr:hypothetical protein KL86DYS1_10498 [uncultured Dysgonomonas sp.]
MSLAIIIGLKKSPLLVLAIIMGNKNRMEKYNLCGYFYFTMSEVIRLRPLIILRNSNYSYFIDILTTNFS